MGFPLSRLTLPALVFVVLPVAIAQEPQLAPPTSTLTVSTQLIVVDVIVEDKDGHPIHGLKKSDFILEENKVEQSIRSFDEHGESAAASRKRSPLPPLPPGTFTNYTPIPPGGTLNVLLLDNLNTPANDQDYVRAQLRKFVAQSPPDARLAIFGLTGSRLTLLQSFTSDPALLKAAVEQKAKPRLSGSLADPLGNGVTPQKLSDATAGDGSVIPAESGAVDDAPAAMAQTVSNLRQFEARISAVQTEARSRFTLDAFNALARYLGAFPGRKNLIWFSQSFPFSISPDPDLPNPFDIVHDLSEQFRETTSLLTRARVAVYPAETQEQMDAVVFTQPNTNKSPGYRKDESELDDFNHANSTLASVHNTMSQMADATGGRAFLDGRPLTAVITSVIDSGSNYYTLTYSPLNHDWDGAYRNIHVKLQGEKADRKLKLAYRQGYYADDPNNRHTAKYTSVVPAASLTAPATGSEAYARAAMQRGAPAPSEVIFEAQVLPAYTTTDKTVFAHNQANPNGSFKGPFRLINVDIVALPRNFSLKASDDGIRRGTIEYVTYVYDVDGQLLNTDTTTLALNIDTELYKKVSEQGLGYHQQISVPARGESFLRIGVHDVPSGRFGAIEVPVSTISKLPPLPTPAPVTPQH